MNNTDLINFLKKYSNISNNFIDDFFSLYTVKTSKNDFVINLENVAKWLKTNRKELKKTLLRSYIKDVDYVIIKKQTKGRPYEETFITSECFKRLCMLSRSEKAEQVFTFEIYKYSKSLKIQ